MINCTVSSPPPPLLGDLVGLYVQKRGKVQIQWEFLPSGFLEQVREVRGKNP